MGVDIVDEPQTNRHVKVALVQMLVEGGNKDRNLDRAAQRIGEAAQHGARIVLLPETMDLGWTHPSSQTEAEPIPDGQPWRRLSEAAKKHKVIVCSGLTERDGDSVFNSAVLIDSDGRLLVKHRKVNELDIGHEYYAQGDRLNVAKTEFGTIGVMICADATAKGQVLSRSLCHMGADMILSPCAWAMPADHDNKLQHYGDLWREAYRPVSTEFAVWILAASNVGEMTGGPWRGQNCIGCSLTVDAEGNEIARGPYGADAETILYVKVVTRPRPARG